jgi:hypothetical protein
MKIKSIGSARHLSAALRAIWRWADHAWPRSTWTYYVPTIGGDVPGIGMYLDPYIVLQAELGRDESQQQLTDSTSAHIEPGNQDSELESAAHERKIV